jgi:hypothetical protein
MTDAQLSLFAGALLSLAFSYVPRLKDWFDTKDATTKRLIMAAALLVIAAGVFAASCGDLLGGLPITVTVACDKNGAVGLATNFVLALIANQATFAISPQKKPTVEEVVTTQAR